MEKGKYTILTPEEEGLRRSNGSDRLIGCYKVNSNGSACFVDIRGEEGNLIKNRVTSEYDLEVEYFSNTQLTGGEFYSFLWGMDSENKGKIVIKGDVRTVQNDEFVKGLFDAKLKLNGSNLEVFNNFQKTIFNEVTGAQHTYIYELLQNSNDYPYNGQSVSVKFILSEHYLFFFHTGDYFNLRNIVGLSSINQGEKRNNSKTIGYKGIGFKTVFVNNDFVYLRSGDWSMRFDQKYSNKQSPDESPWASEYPWALMPIPTNINELDDEARLVINSVSADMRVQFALRHKSDASQNLEQLDKVFGDNQILLFIPNVHKVEVIVDNITRHKVEKDPSKWIVYDFEYTVSEELKSWVAKNIRSNNKIPEKFKDIDTVRISFAVGRDGDIITPVENARVYSYLPTELKLGFKFLFNANFVPDGSRSSLHPIKWNSEIMLQCGHKFADWWVGLLQNEGEYDMSSVFSILPDDYKSKDNYKSEYDYKSLFLKGFSERLSEIPCIPAIRNGKYKLYKLSEIVYDEEEFIVSDTPVLTDEEFYKYCGGEYTIAHHNIKCNKNLELLLRNFTIGKIFTAKNVYDLCLKASFASWLKVKENNTKFLGFLLNNDYINNCCNYSIFLKSDGRLSSADKIHYDIDKYINDIGFLGDELPRLDIEVRDELKRHNNWMGHGVKFKDFSIYIFTKQIIDNFEKHKNLFHEKHNSVNFVHFLSVTDSQFELPETYPLWLDDGNVITERTNLFIRNAIGDNFKSRSWIDKNWICYIDNAYLERSRDKIISYLSQRCSIIELKNKDCYSKFISSDKYTSQIAKYIKSKDVNIDFYHYLSGIQEEISNLPPNIRKLYTLLTTDGNDIYNTPITNVIFKNDDQWLQMAQAEWMPNNCCLSVVNDYFTGLDSSKSESLSAFLSSKQIVQNFSIQELFSKCIKQRITDVYAKITTKELSKDFLNFIFTNRTNIFKGDVTDDYFKDIPILCLDKHEFTNIKNNIYITNKDVMTLYNQPWFNRETIAICDTSYTELFDGRERLGFFKKIGLKPFDRLSYLRSRILLHIDKVANDLRDREYNIAFHNYICSMHEELSEDEFKKIKTVPIYVSSPTHEEGELFDRSCDLSLPSSLLTDIINQDLVPISILGSIHPDYITSESSAKYFSDKLGNREMDIAGFIEHITENKELVSSYLQNKERNIRFWRWVYMLEETLELKSKLKHFPIMSAVDNDNVKFLLPANMYLSDDYSDSLELESFINEYVPNADFLSSLYKLEGDINNKWKSLFRVMGVKVNTRDIVFINILPELVKFKQKSIVPILAEYIDEFAKDLKVDDKKDNLSSKLKLLQLYCVDGTYRTATDVIVSGRYFGINPGVFNEIEIANQLSEHYISDCGDNDNLRRGVINFIKLIADNYSKKCETKTQLREAKLRYFIENQKEYLDLKQHYSIISQLADAYNDDSQGVGELIEKLNLNNLRLYTKSDEIKCAQDLYLSSIYLPDCDFMTNGVNELDFINESYCQLSVVDHKELFVKLGVRSRFEEEHLLLLSNDQFARYFWEIYAPKREYSLKYYITDEILKNTPCIPTNNGVKRPSDLYDYRQQTLQKIVLKLNDGESYLPSVVLPKWIDKIGLRGRLYIPHCFEYLNLNNIDYRREVIRWITETYDVNLNKNSDIIAEYAKNALWLNGEKDWIALNELVAIEWGNETLKGSFGGNKYICSPSYMPESQTDYCKLCDILGIKILNNSDFKKDKDGIRDKAAISKISKCLTYLAWKSGKENWQEIDTEYQDNLSQADICSCKSISYFYNENIKANPKSYTEDSQSLWYVGMWNGPMFGKIQDWIKTKINIKGEFDSNFMDDLFLDEFDEFIAKHEGGKLPEELHTLLSDADKLSITVDENASAEQFEDNDEISSEQLYDTGSENDKKLDDSDLKPEYNNNHQSIDSEKLQPNNSSNTTIDHKQTQSTCNPRSETQTNNGSRQSKQATDIKRPSVGDKLENKWNEKMNKVVARPTTAAPRNIEDNTIKNERTENVEEPFFTANQNYSHGRSQSNTSRASQNIKTKNTEAKKLAEKAEDQLELFNLWQGEKLYTFIWYKYLMELQNIDKNRTSGRNITVDFLNYEISDNGEILRLSLPSVNVPKWIEEADVVLVTLVSPFAKLKATIIRVTELEVELFIDSNDAKKIVKGQKVRIYAEQTINFIDSLETRFIQLDYSNDYNLQENLPDNVEFIYGPPGTGKTTRLVERLRNIMIEPDKNVNVLVLTPTNKAADVIAHKLFCDKTCCDYIKRYGSTESSALIESGVLVTRDTIDMTLSNKNIVVATAARYPYDFLQPNNIAICDYPWDYIIIDEASMIDLVMITYILHKGDGAHFIIAGDPKQIEPISQNNIDIQNIYELVGLDSFEDAIHNYDRFLVETLMVQHRSVPTIGNLISKFAYNGLVENDLQRDAQKPLELDGIEVKDINFVGFKIEPLDNLYGVTAINNSAFHLYAAIFTYNMVEYVVSQLTKNSPTEDYTIGIVCPYGAEANTINQLLENRPLSINNCKVTSGTVHKFQGDECDIMFIVLNPPMNVSSGSHINKDNIINVAMSRARDYIFFVLPEGQIDGYNIKNRLGNIINNDDRSILKCPDIESVIFDSRDYIYQNTNITCHMPVNVYYDNSAKYNVRIDDMNIDIQVKLE